MFGKTLGGAQAYASVGLTTSAAAANPHELIVMLFDGALLAISAALHEIEEMDGKNVSAKALAISKATRIINEGLRASLNPDAGGPLALQLDALYHYVSTELILASAANDAQKMKAAKALLADIADAWRSMPQDVRNAPPPRGLAA
jgi:flagellar protein FliS